MVKNFRQFNAELIKIFSFIDCSPSASYFSSFCGVTVSDSEAGRSSRRCEGTFGTFIMGPFTDRSNLHSGLCDIAHEYLELVRKKCFSLSKIWIYRPLTAAAMERQKRKKLF